MEANSDEEIDEQRPCEFCNGSYKSKKILLEHVRGIHKPKYFCNDCQITLNNHKSYEKHLKERIKDMNPVCKLLYFIFTEKSISYHLSI